MVELQKLHLFSRFGCFVLTFYVREVGLYTYPKTTGQTQTFSATQANRLHSPGLIAYAMSAFWS